MAGVRAPARRPSRARGRRAAAAGRLVRGRRRPDGGRDRRRARTAARSRWPTTSAPRTTRRPASRPTTSSRCSARSSGSPPRPACRSRPISTWRGARVDNVAGLGTAPTRSPARSPAATGTPSPATCAALPADERPAYEADGRPRRRLSGVASKRDGARAGHRDRRRVPQGARRRAGCGPTRRARADDGLPARRPRVADAPRRGATATSSPPRSSSTRCSSAPTRTCRPTRATSTATRAIAEANGVDYLFVPPTRGDVPRSRCSPRYRRRVSAKVSRAARGRRTSPASPPSSPSCSTSPAPAAPTSARRTGSSCQVVRRMAADLSFPVEVIGCADRAGGRRPRHVEPQRVPLARRARRGTVLHRALLAGGECVLAGAARAKDAMAATVAAEPLAALDYAEVVETDTEYRLLVGGPPGHHPPHRQHWSGEAMRRRMMKSKIHRATVTDANLNYVGSITLDTRLMELADMREWEQVAVLDIDNGARFETYVIPGGPGEICLNGAARAARPSRRQGHRDHLRRLRRGRAGRLSTCDRPRGRQQ